MVKNFPFAISSATNLVHSIDMFILLSCNQYNFFISLSLVSYQLVTLLIYVFIQTKNNSPAAQEKCITRLLLYHFGVNLPVMLLSYPVFKFMGMRSSLPLPSWYFQVLYILKLFLLDIYNAIIII